MRSELDNRRRSMGSNCSVAIGRNEIATTGTIHAAITFRLADAYVLKTEAGEA